jgi:hypothetical protein
MYERQTWENMRNAHAVSDNTGGYTIIDGDNEKLWSLNPPAIQSLHCVSL